MTRLAILGAGELGRQIAHHAPAAGLRPIGFFDDPAAAARESATGAAAEAHGLPVLGGLQDAPARRRSGDFDAALLAVGYRHRAARQSLFEGLSAAGLPFATLVHPSCSVDPSATLGPGCVLLPGCVIDLGVTLEANVLLHVGCCIAHDSRLGAHGFCGPGVRLAGRVTVGARAFLGIGTVISDHLTLGDDVQTGAGAVVIRDDPGGRLLVGVPARVADH
ncbi:MAG: hypothetical protein AAF725_15590 [Acidobacteriota bacterium]